MTREEALKILKDCRRRGFERNTYTVEEYHTARDMAIKALEQEPCEDTISRQAVFEQINCWIGSGEYRYTNATDYLTKRVANLSSIQPEPKMGYWIWCVGSHKCSNCEEYTCFSFKKPPRYCPNCGARMVDPLETETWNGMHGQITAPKGTFERIFNDADDDNDI